MKLFRRNQVEEAISVVLEGLKRRPSNELRLRIKRLLDADRELGRDVRSKAPEKQCYAFFSGELPGKGTEVAFSEFEAFAVLLALRLLEHGWTQGFAVQQLRILRPTFERDHRRMLAEAPRPRTRPPRAGDLAIDIDNPVFLSILSQSTPNGDRDQPAPFVDFDEIAPFRRLMSKPGQSMTSMEVRTQAHALSTALTLTEPKRRGRP